MITIKNGYILEGKSLVKKDLYIENGKIIKIEDELEVLGEVVDALGGFIMPGATDVHVHLREPGFSYKETIKTGTMASVKGGVTTCLAMPNLRPCPDSLANLAVEEELINKDAVCHVYPYGAVTVNQEDKVLANIDEYHDQVYAITDDGRGVNNMELLESAMKKALKYDIFYICEVAL